LETDGTQTFSEGCLSFPGEREDIKRAESVRVRALDAKGEPFELHATGLLADAIQHENDHINGVLMIDKVGAIARRKIGRQMARIRQEATVSGAAIPDGSGAGAAVALDRLRLADGRLSPAQAPRGRATPSLARRDPGRRRATAA